MLVVDDDDSIIEAVSEVLEDDGYAVLVAFGGDEAWMTMQKHAPVPDAVLLDLKMPGGDGWCLLRRLRQDPKLADIPVVVMTAGPAPMLDAISGAAAHVSKPLHLDTLLETIRRALGTRGRVPPTARSSSAAADWAFDFD